MSSAEVGSSRTTNDGLEHDRAGDADPLALAARELVRVALLARRIEPDLLEHPRDQPPAAGAIAAEPMQLQPSSMIWPIDMRGERLP